MPRAKKTEEQPETETSADVTLDNTVLLENLPALRFVDKGGNFYALEQVPFKDGYFWLVPKK